MKHLSVQRAAKMLGVHRNTLIQWELREEIPKAARNPKNGYRIYTTTDVLAIAAIKNIQYINTEWVKK